MFLRHFGSHVAVRTPAKLNLFLEVLGKRADGYHELETLMTTVGIYDRLEVASRDDGQVALECAWAPGIVASSQARTRCGGATAFEPLPTGPDNLVVRTAQRLRERAGESRGADLRLRKTIPAAAGLGGASADAAATLTALNALWNLQWSPARLAEVAAEVGSDVPFFLGDEQGPADAAVCRGRGERIERTRCAAPLHCVVVRPPAGLSTAAVFRACRPAQTPRSSQPLAEALRSGDLRRLGASLHNRLQEPASELSPWIVRLRDWFGKYAIVGHQMSGSGTSYFGICRSAREASRLANLARLAGWDAVFVGAAPAV
ncbi:MAG: hypothetical protein U0939_16285 [Pirellulales bacterium]